MDATINETEQCGREEWLLGDDIFIFEFIAGDVLGDGGKSKVDDRRLTEDESEDKLEVGNLVEEVAMSCRYVDLLGGRNLWYKEDAEIIRGAGSRSADGTGPERCR